MNERIRLLAEQSRWQEIVVEDGKEWIHAHFLEGKFAELIVRECIAELEKSKRCDPYTGELFACEYNDCLNDQITMLKDHFGVEE